MMIVGIAAVSVALVMLSLMLAGIWDAGPMAGWWLS
jgi:hypothetical protein